MDYVFLSKTVLFRGMIPNDIESLLTCMNAQVKSYSKGDIVFNVGDYVKAMGLVLSGSVYIENDDMWGNKSILDKIGPGQIFAETYACVPGEPLMINVVANEKTDILFLNTEHMLTTCTDACAFHSKVIRNMLEIASQKSLNLSRRILHTSSKTIRGRLLSYLSFQSTKQGVQEFDIPFNRQQLADYLSIDRSAMSNELSKMQKDGLIVVDKNHFILHNIDSVI